MKVERLWYEQIIYHFLISNYGYFISITYDLEIKNNTRLICTQTKITV